MKLSQKAKKRLILAGCGVVCAILVIAISMQFNKVQPEDEAILPSPAVAEDVYPGPKNPNSDPAIGAGLNVDPTVPSPSPADPADTADSSGTEQSLQAEPIKPEPPAETPAPQDDTAVSNPEKTPEYKPEDTVKTTPKGPEGGEKKDGKIFVPGFGWIEDHGGGNAVSDVTSDGDINNQVGSMG